MDDAVRDPMALLFGTALQQDAPVERGLVDHEVGRFLPQLAFAETALASQKATHLILASNWFANST